MIKMLPLDLLNHVYSFLPVIELMGVSKNEKELWSDLLERDYQIVNYTNPYEVYKEKYQYPFLEDHYDVLMNLFLICSRYFHFDSAQVIDSFMTPPYAIERLGVNFQDSLYNHYFSKITSFEPETIFLPRIVEIEINGSTTRRLDGNDLTFEDVLKLYLGNDWWIVGFTEVGIDMFPEVNSVDHYSFSNCKGGKKLVVDVTFQKYYGCDDFNQK